MMFDIDDSPLAPDVQPPEPAEPESGVCDYCGEQSDELVEGACPDCNDPDNMVDDSEWRAERQEQYDADFPPMADWMQTELEYRSRPEGY